MSRALSLLPLALVLGVLPRVRWVRPRLKTQARRERAARLCPGLRPRAEGIVGRMGRIARRNGHGAPAPLPPLPVRVAHPPVARRAVGAGPARNGRAEGLAPPAAHLHAVHYVHAVGGLEVHDVHWRSDRGRPVPSTLGVGRELVQFAG